MQAGEYEAGLAIGGGPSILGRTEDQLSGYSPPVVGLAATFWLSVAVAVIGVAVLLWLTIHRRGTCLYEWRSYCAVNQRRGWPWMAVGREEEHGMAAEPRELAEVRFGGAGPGLSHRAAIAASVFGGPSSKPGDDEASAEVQHVDGGSL